MFFDTIRSLFNRLSPDNTFSAESASERASERERERDVRVQLWRITNPNVIVKYRNTRVIYETAQRPTSDLHSRIINMVKIALLGSSICARERERGLTNRGSSGIFSNRLLALQTIVLFLTHPSASQPVDCNSAIRIYSNSCVTAGGWNSLN